PEQVRFRKDHGKPGAPGGKRAESGPGNSIFRAGAVRIAGSAEPGKANRGTETSTRFCSRQPATFAVNIQPAQPGRRLLLLLGLLTFLCYLPVVRHDFINIDDRYYILENPHVVTGLTWSNIVWAFSSGYASNWHPLTWISHMLDCQLFGVKPAGHHLVNAL